MPKYYCDYCDMFLTHDSPSVRKTHLEGKFHRENYQNYYLKVLKEQAQKMVNEELANFNQQLVMPINPTLNIPYSSQINGTTVIKSVQKLDTPLLMNGAQFVSPGPKLEVTSRSAGGIPTQMPLAPNVVLPPVNVSPIGHVPTGALPSVKTETNLSQSSNLLDSQLSQIKVEATLSGQEN